MADILNKNVLQYLIGKIKAKVDGKYTKPNNGIPKTDLASAVQTSLGKADTALQSFTETDPTVPSHVKSITTDNISNWNAKASTATATTSANGLMSSTDKTTLNNIAANYALGTCATARNVAAKVVTLAGFVLNVGDTIAVKFTDTTTTNPASGNLTMNVNSTGAKNIRYCRNGAIGNLTYSAAGAFYNNLTHIFTYDGTGWMCLTYNADNNTTYVFNTEYNKDTNKAATMADIPTETTVSGWGFTKNTGTYSKPSGGIPKTDLASAVQTSLGKADTALQLPAGTTNHIVNYTSANAIGSAAKLTYQRLENQTVNKATNVVKSILRLYDSTYGNSADSLTSATLGVMSYGDGGPQLQFSTAETGGQEGAIIYTDNDQAGKGVSWHFVSNQTDWSVNSKRFVAKTSVTVGSNLQHSTAEALHVTGDAKITGTIYSNGKAVLTDHQSLAGLVPYEIISTAVDANTLTSKTCLYSVKTSTMSNMPLTNYGLLYVDANVGTKYQIYFPDNYTEKAYKRYYNNTDSKWNDWVELKLTDTKNTAGSTDTSSKIFLVGATSQAANPQTYSDNQVYVENGTLYLTKTTDSTITGDNHPALEIGNPTGEHIEIDGNEINAKATGTTKGTLYLQQDAGEIYFGGNITGNKLSAPRFISKSSDMVRGTAPSANHWGQSFWFQDKNGASFGGIEHGYLPDLTNRMNLIVFKGTNATDTANAQIAVGWDKDGNWFTYAPTPASTDNSTKIATTAFVNTKAAGYLPLTGGTLTGATKAPTPALNSGDTTLATTAFHRKARIYCSSSSFATAPWFKFASITLKNANDERYITFDVKETFIYDTTNTKELNRGALHVFVRNASNIANAPTAYRMEWHSMMGTMDRNKYVLVATQAADKTSWTYELWFKVTYRYNGMIATVVDEHDISGNTYNWTLESTSTSGVGSASYTASNYTFTSVIPDKAKFMTAKLLSSSNFYGLVTPDGLDTSWLRTSTTGIIPYQAGGAGDGHSALGTTTWRFKDTYTDRINGSDVDALIKEVDKHTYKYLSSSINYYVSPTGNDTTGDGTSSKPWKSIQYAIDRLPYSEGVSGNVSVNVYIAAGTYTEEHNIKISRKRVQLVFQGDVTIVAGIANQILIAIEDNSRVNIQGNSSTAANFRALTLQGGSQIIRATGGSTTTIQYLKSLSLSGFTSASPIQSICNSELYFNATTCTISYDFISCTGTTITGFDAERNGWIYLSLGTGYPMTCTYATTATNRYACRAYACGNIGINGIGVDNTWTIAFVADYSSQLNWKSVSSKAGKLTTMNNGSRGLSGYHNYIGTYDQVYPSKSGTYAMTSDLPITIKNVAITAHTDNAALGFAHELTVDLSSYGVTADHSPQVFFSKEQLATGNYSSYAEINSSKKLVILSKTTEHITIPLIICTK